jgi:hypothetical protein
MESVAPVWSEAVEMHRQYGDSATWIAALRADEMEEMGDAAGAAYWWDVLGAITEYASASTH